MKRLLQSSTLVLFLLSVSVTAQRALPNPILVLDKLEYYQATGKQYVRYHYSVFNSEAYPADMFAASPDLPPCGKNTRSARTWIDFYDERGARLYGFCALGKSEDLRDVWFNAEAGTLPPSWVYVEMTDRKTNTKYKSNLAETVP